MSSVITEKKKVYGYIEAHNQTFAMLKQFPNRFDVPSTLRDVGFLSVYVLDHDGFAKNIYVNGNILIRPLVVDEFVDVKFFVEDTQDVQS